jgi:hypothetical protein
VSKSRSVGGDPGLVEEIAARWSRFFPLDVPLAESWERASFVAVEPDDAGTWCVRIHAAGEADLIAGGLNRAQATETMMGLMEVLSRRYAHPTGSPWHT